MTDKTTHFGFQDIPWQDKTERVGAVFDSVSSRYDLMNDLMSFGVHRYWKHIMGDAVHLKPDHHLLDIATGTGDLALLFAKKIGLNGKLTLTDINASMLKQGQKHLINQGFIKKIQYVQANAECLPFEPNTFDRVTIAFGLRNVTHIDNALRSMYRVLKPGGRLVILEFSHPTHENFKKIYDLYSFSVLPFLGKLICNDSASYQYLVESIRMHPKQEALCTLLQEAGFEDCQYQNLSGGIVAIHKGFKF